MSVASHISKIGLIHIYRVVVCLAVKICLNYKSGESQRGGLTLGKVFKLVYSKQANLFKINDKSSTFALNLIEPNPTDRS